MADESVVDYIRQNRGKYSDEELRQTLIGGGHKEEAVAEAFRFLDAGKKPARVKKTALKKSAPEIIGPPKPRKGRRFLVIIGLLAMVGAFGIAAYFVLPGLLKKTASPKPAPSAQPSAPPLDGERMAVDEQARATAESLAGRKDMGAQALLGRFYVTGYGVKKEPWRGKRMIRDAVEQGDGKALMIYGEMHMSGTGVKRDLKVARGFLQDANKTYPPAAFYLGKLYLEEGNSAEGRHWLGDAAKRGDRRAMYALYEADRKQTAWLDKAAAAGLPAALFAKGSAFAAAKDFTRARASYQKAADGGDRRAAFQLGLLYKLGQGGEKDPVQARRWFNSSASRGYAMGQHNLAVMLLDDDPLEAFKWFTLAAEQGFKESVKTVEALQAKMAFERYTEARKRAREFKVIEPPLDEELLN
ncbi:MAG: tetratricopeptide repeat protein [Elusimicrobiota bacterium]